MGIKIEIPLVLQQATGNRGLVEVEGRTVRECMDSLMQRYPGTQEWFNRDNPMVWIVLNQDIVKLPDLDQQVTEDDSLGLVLLVGGG